MYIDGKALDRRYIDSSEREMEKGIGRERAQMIVLRNVNGARVNNNPLDTMVPFADALLSSTSTDGLYSSPCSANINNTLRSTYYLGI